MTPPSGNLSCDSIQPKIQDIKVMVLQGPSRNYTLVKIIADDGIYGIGEAYGSPAAGVKAQIEAVKPTLIGKNPLEIDAIYTGMGTRTTARRTL